jgi:hypothetical protein
MGVRPIRRGQACQFASATPIKAPGLTGAARAARLLLADADEVIE